MSVIEEAIATLGIPGSIAVVIVAIFAVLQLIGEVIEWNGKVAPVALKVRKLFTRNAARRKEYEQTLQDVKTALNAILVHCNPENIEQRNEWMSWVNSRAELYDNTVNDYLSAKDMLVDAINRNTKMTEQMFVENSRDRIIDFASKVSNPMSFVSREEFHRIFKVYEKYENFLEEHNMTNGEVEINYQIIRDAYVERTQSHNFIEDLRNMTPPEQ